MKQLDIIAIVLLVGCAFLPENAVALQSQLGGNSPDQIQIINTMGAQTSNAVIYTESFFYGFAALGAIGLSALAFFGRFKWSWFFSLIAGCVIVGGLTSGTRFLAGHNIQADPLMTLNR